MWQTQGPFWGWAVASAVIGLGFAFFSGAVEAWLVDALGACGYEGDLESVFAKGQIVQGVGMLTGSVAGGFIAQLTNLGVPYIVRAVMLGVTMAVAFALMRDQGFQPVKAKHPVTEVKRVLRESLHGGFGKPPVRWLMLEAPFTMGVGIFAFYAMQPYLLELYGDPSAFGIAGLAAAVVAGAQIVGGMVVPLVRRLVRRRTDALLAAAIISVASLVFMGLTDSFIVALGLLVVWALTDAARMPMRQAFLNGLIPSAQRATVLSFDSLMGSAGGVVAQPALGRVADVGGYAASYVVSGAITALSIPFVALARREKASSDPITPVEPVPDVDQPQVPPESGTLPGG
jgi:hypothetical protein